MATWHFSELAGVVPELSHSRQLAIAQAVQVMVGAVPVFLNPALQLSQAVGVLQAPHPVAVHAVHAFDAGVATYPPVEACVLSQETRVKVVPSVVYTRDPAAGVVTVTQAGVAAFKAFPFSHTQSAAAFCPAPPVEPAVVEPAGQAVHSRSIAPEALPGVSPSAA